MTLLGLVEFSDGAEAANLKFHLDQLGNGDGTRDDVAHKTRQEIVEDFLEERPVTLFGRSWDVKTTKGRTEAAAWLISVLDDDMPSGKTSAAVLIGDPDDERDAFMVSSTCV